MRLLISDSVSLLVISLLRFSIPSSFGIDRLYVSRNLSVSPRLSDLLAYNCSSFGKTGGLKSITGSMFHVGNLRLRLVTHP